MIIIPIQNLPKALPPGYKYCLEASERGGVAGRQASFLI